MIENARHGQPRPIEIATDRRHHVSLQAEAAMNLDLTRRTLLHLAGASSFAAAAAAAAAAAPRKGTFKAG